MLSVDLFHFSEMDVCDVDVAVRLVGVAGGVVSFVVGGVFVAVVDAVVLAFGLYTSIVLVAVPTPVVDVAVNSIVYVVVVDVSMFISFMSF